MSDISLNFALLFGTVVDPFSFFVEIKYVVDRYVNFVLQLFTKQSTVNKAFAFVYFVNLIFFFVNLIFLFSDYLETLHKENHKILLVHIVELPSTFEESRKLCFLFDVNLNLFHFKIILGGPFSFW